MQAIYAALKDGKGLEGQYLLGNIDSLDEASAKNMDLPKGITGTDYMAALKGDIVGLVRKLTSTCHVSGKHREELEATVLEGNQNGMWMDNHGNSVSIKTLQLLRDSETRWSSTHFMVDQILETLPVCVTNTLPPLTQIILGH